MNRLLEGQLAFMSIYFDVKGIASPDRGSDVLRKRENVDLIDLKMNRSISPFQDIISIIKMYAIFRKEKPDIIHSHTPKAGLVAMIAGKIAGVPIRLHTIAGLPLETSKGLKKKILFFVERVIYKFSTRTYANSFGIKNFILEHNLIEKSKLGLIANGSSNGIDLNHFKRDETLEEKALILKKEFGIQPNEKIFLFVGRLVIDKGIEPLISAWKILQKENKNIKLVLVGDFESKLSPIPEYVTKAILEDETIVFTGYQWDVRPFFILADFFVFPSFREGLPNVLLQASAMEIPMIVTKINGNTDIVEDGLNGTIVPVNDAESLYMAMRLFLFNPELCKKYIENAYLSVIEKYDRVLIHQSLLNEYKRLYIAKNEK